MKKEETLTEYMTFDQVMEYLPGFTERYLRYLVAINGIPHIKPTERKILFSRRDIDLWLDRRKIAVEYSSRLTT